MTFRSWSVKLMSRHMFREIYSLDSKAPVFRLSSSIFSDDDYAPSSVTDRSYQADSYRTPNENVASPMESCNAPVELEINETTTTNAQNDCEGSISDIENNSNTSNSVPSVPTSTGTEQWYAAPNAIQPFPKAPP